MDRTSMKNTARLFIRLTGIQRGCSPNEAEVQFGDRIAIVPANEIFYRDGDLGKCCYICFQLRSIPNGSKYMVGDITEVQGKVREVEVSPGLVKMLDRKDLKRASYFDELLRGDAVKSAPDTKRKQELQDITKPVDEAYLEVRCLALYPRRGKIKVGFDKNCSRRCMMSMGDTFFTYGAFKKGVRSDTEGGLARIVLISGIPGDPDKMVDFEMTVADGRRLRYGVPARYVHKSKPAFYTQNFL